MRLVLAYIYENEDNHTRLIEVDILVEDKMLQLSRFRNCINYAFFCVVYSSPRPRTLCTATVVTFSPSVANVKKHLPRNFQYNKLGQVRYLRINLQSVSIKVYSTSECIPYRNHNTNHIHTFTIPAIRQPTMSLNCFEVLIRNSRSIVEAHDTPNKK